MPNLGDTATCAACGASIVYKDPYWEHIGKNPRHLAEPKELGESVREQLAAYAHEAWSGWMRYQFSKGTFNEDGTWTMPAWAVDRWQRQMHTFYADLPESEKASDRDEADKMLAIIERAK